MSAATPNRAHQRAVRAYMRANPGTTLPQARAAVAARAGHQTDLPPLVDGVPAPADGETLVAYVKRAAANMGVGTHRAIELLGLEPGDSASMRLLQLADRMPKETVAKLCAATGMSPDQAQALADASDRDRYAQMARDLVLNVRPGGTEKTTHRVLAFDLDPQGQLSWPALTEGVDADRLRSSFEPMIIDVPPAAPRLPSSAELDALASPGRLRRGRGESR